MNYRVGTTRLIVLSVFLTTVFTLACSIEGRYALAGDIVWQIETVDSEGWVGYHTSLALDGSDNPHISYFDFTDEQLNYAYHDGAIWHIQAIPGTGFMGLYTSLALDEDDHPHISHFDIANEDLKYTYYDGMSWQTQTVDDALGWITYTSIALDNAGNPHISYTDADGDDLKYAYYNGVSWDIHTVDINVVGDDISTSIALDNSGRPHIGYPDHHGGDLKYAYYNGISWSIEVVDAPVTTGEVSLTLDSGDNPHLSYEDWDHSDLKYAYHDGISWHIETVDESGAVGVASCITTDSGDNPHISYLDQINFSLKYAYYDGTWHTETVDGDDDVGWDNSIALDSDDNPHISYKDDTNDDLKYAVAIPSCVLTISVTAGGTTDPIPGEHAYACDSPVDVTAIPDECYVFDHWELDEVDVGSANPYPVLMDDDHTLLAVFVQIDHELTISTTLGGTTNPSPGIHTYGCGSMVEVSAVEDVCYELDHWELDGYNVGSANPYSVLMDDDHALLAVFTSVDYYDLTISTTAGGTTNPSPGIHTYTCGSSVPVAANNDPGHMFHHWELNSIDVGSVNPYLVFVDGNHALLAVFVNTSCDCGVWGDVNGDGNINPVDVVYMVNFVYLGNDMRIQPPICPLEAGDANCDGNVNPVDVVFYVNFVYLGNDMFCPDPCGE